MIALRYPKRRDQITRHDDGSVTFWDAKNYEWVRTKKLTYSQQQDFSPYRREQVLKHLK